jgi:hypothetical protein
MWHNFRGLFPSFSALKAVGKLGCPDQAPISKLQRFLEIFWLLLLLLNRQGRLMTADDVAAFGVACEPAEHLEAAQLPRTPSRRSSHQRETRCSPSLD